MRGRARTVAIRIALVLAVAVGVVAFGAARAGAAEPSTGTVDAAHPTFEWLGAIPVPELVSTTSCPLATTPTCDVVTLTVGALPAQIPDLVVSIDGDDDADVTAVNVYGPDGTLLVASDDVAASHTVRVPNAAPGVYSIRVEALLYLPPSTGSYHGVATAAAPGSSISLDDDGACGDTVRTLTPPLDIIEEGLPEDGVRPRLDVLVLLDEGVTEARARQVFDGVAAAYATAGIDVAATYLAGPPFTSTVSTEIIAQARQRFPGGLVPVQYDVVEVLTAKDITVAGQSAVAGQADCGGGIAYKTRSYNVSESHFAGLDGALGDRLATVVTAHEIGHLLGGQHHFANCAEGTALEDPLAFTPCSLMFNDASVGSLRFSSVNAPIVRGYARRYATANDALAPTPAVAELPAGGAALAVATAGAVAALVAVRRRRGGASRAG